MAGRAAALAAAIACSHAACITDKTAGLHENVPCDTLRGMKVTYNVPAKCLSEKCGLIFDVHGYSMNAAQQDANTNMRALGAQNGYIVVQPSAPLGNWLPVTTGPEKAVFGWLQEALALSEWKIDTNKLHFTGFSQGAIFTSQMICDHSDIFASFVVMEGPDPRCLKKGALQPPVLVQNGLHDLAMTDTTMRAALGAYKDVWGLGEGELIAGKADGDWHRLRFMGPTGVPFEFLNYTYVADYALKGHCFPGSKDLHILDVPGQAGPFGCPGLKEQATGQKAGYFIGDEVMKWFLAHPKGSAPPSPPAPPAQMYACQHNKCITAASGLPKADCEAACGSFMA